MRISSLYRVEPSSGKRMAAQQTVYPKRHSLEQAVLFQSLQRVLGTARRKPAGRRQHGGESTLVYPDQPYRGFRNHRMDFVPSSGRSFKQSSFRSAPTSSSSNSEKLASAAGGRAEMTKSDAPDTRGSVPWKASLSLLRTRLRVTALPTFLDTERPNLGFPSSFGNACTEKNLPLKALP